MDELHKLEAEFLQHYRRFEDFCKARDLSNMEKALSRMAEVLSRTRIMDNPEAEADINETRRLLEEMAERVHDAAVLSGQAFGIGRQAIPGSDDLLH